MWDTLLAMYIPPSQRSHNATGKSVHVVMGNDDTSNSSEFIHSIPFETGLNSTPSTDHVNAKMDQLQNQVNQVLLMMQHKQDHTTANNLSLTKLVGNYAGICSSQFKKFTFIASFNSSSKGIWIIDSGETDHICISLTLMHNIHTHTTPMHVILPNGNSIKVQTVGLMRV